MSQSLLARASDKRPSNRQKWARIATWVGAFWPTCLEFLGDIDSTMRTPDLGGYTTIAPLVI